MPNIFLPNQTQHTYEVEGDGPVDITGRRVFCLLGHIQAFTCRLPAFCCCLLFFHTRREGPHTTTISSSLDWIFDAFCLRKEELLAPVFALGQFWLNQFEIKLRKSLESLLWKKTTYKLTENFKGDCACWIENKLLDLSIGNCLKFHMFSPLCLHFLIFLVR